MHDTLTFESPGVSPGAHAPFLLSRVPPIITALTTRKGPAV